MEFSELRRVYGKGRSVSPIPPFLSWLRSARLGLIGGGLLRLLVELKPDELVVLVGDNQEIALIFVD
jgi:hypothetical protein